MVSFTKIVDLGNWLDAQYITENGDSLEAYNLTINYSDSTKLMDTAIGIKQQFNNWAAEPVKTKSTNSSISYKDYTINVLGDVIVASYDISGNLVI